MTHESFENWLKQMRWSAYKASKALGISSGLIAKHRASGADWDTRTALACAALQAGLLPFKA